MATRTATTVVRADVVGSLLRPDYLREAREAALAGTIDADELRAVEDQAVLEAIALQESAGIEAITDGEYRRHGWIALIPIVDDPLFRAPVERLRVPRRGVRLARPLEDGRRASPPTRPALPPQEPFVTRRLEVDRDIVDGRVRVPQGERPRAREVHDPGAELAPDLLASRVLDRRVPDVGRLHRGRRPHPARARHRPAGRARLRLHPDRRAQLRAVAHRPGKPRGVRGARPRHGARARRGRRVRQHGLRGPDRRHARDAHVPRQCSRRHVGRDRRLRGDLEAGLPAPHEHRPAAARVRLGPRRHLRAARRRLAESPGRARARDDEGRSPRGPRRARRAGRGGDAIRAARTARYQPAVRLRVGRDRAR